MNRNCLLAAGFLLWAANLHAAVYDVGGFVYCDANQNGQIDSGDTPVSAALVIVVNASGSFMGSNWTVPPNGGWVIEVPTTPDTYTVSVHPASLPSDATLEIPAGGSYSFSIDATHTNFLGNFLFKSATCASSTPPPPPPPPPPPGTGSNDCCLKAHGMIRSGPGMPDYIFAGSALPGCGSNSDDRGEWELVEKSPKLHFKGSVFQITNCGQDTNSATGDVFSFIEFQGIGTLKGIGRNKANYGAVTFSARAEDYGQSVSAADQIYFRVDASDGTTLLLLSGDANPQNVVPVPVSKGELRIGTSCCSKGDQGDADDDDNGGEHHQGGNKGQGKQGHQVGKHGPNHGKSGKPHGQGEHGHGG